MGGCARVFADDWKCNLFWGGGRDPGPSSAPTPSALHQTALCSPLGALKKHSCPLCPYVFVLVYVWKIRPFCLRAYMCVLTWACVRPF